MDNWSLGGANNLSHVDDDQHWVNWHSDYDDPLSYISRRLRSVQRRLAGTLDVAPGGPIRLISMCAGQGRDVIGVLEEHQRALDVRALLVELDVQLAEDARQRARRAGLRNVEVHVGDASVTSAYQNAVPADILLACGIFGNISDADIHATIARLPTLLARNATVIWTRHRRDPDLTPRIREWFHDFGFEEVAFDTEEGALFSVGSHRLISEPQTFDPNQKLFTFFGDGAAANQ